MKLLILIFIIVLILLLVGCKNVTKPEDEIVYINPPELADPLYHCGDGNCRGYSVNYSNSISRSEAERLGYKPCPRCFGDE